MKLRLNEKQQMWRNIHNCAIQRSNEYFISGDLERHAREHSTAMLAIHIGEKFWMIK